MAYYDSIAKGYNRLHRQEQTNKIRIIKDFFEISERTKLLDVGCGTGFSLEMFDCDCMGIDPSEELLRQCKKPCIKGVAEDLPFEDDYFDIVISVTSVHNFTDAEKALDEMRRVTKKYVVISLLKKSKNYEKIKDLIEKKFNILKIVNEKKDVIFFLEC